MRAICCWAGVLGVVLLAPAARAQTAVPFTYENRTIVQSEVEVRSGPSLSYYPTGKLARGEAVQVVTNKKDGAADGWLAIKPPRGSFSWINAENVTYQPNQTTGIVKIMGAPVLTGSALDNRPPTVRSAVLDRGAMVVILGQPLLTSDGSHWLPIEPHPTEVRYIPAAAVGAPAGEAIASRGQGPDAASHTNPFGSAGTAAVPAVAAAGQGGTGGVRTALMAARPTNNAPAATSMYGPAPANAPAPSATAGYAPAPAPAEQWNGPGWLRKTGFEFENRPVYRLETYEKLICYVVAQPGFSLDQYLAQNVNNRQVYLWGALSYRGDVARAALLTARSASVR